MFWAAIKLPFPSPPPATAGLSLLELQRHGEVVSSVLCISWCENGRIHCHYTKCLKLNLCFHDDLANTTIRKSSWSSFQCITYSWLVCVPGTFPWQQSDWLFMVLSDEGLQLPPRPMHNLEQPCDLKQGISSSTDVARDICQPTWHSRLYLHQWQGSFGIAIRR